MNKIKHEQWNAQGTHNIPVVSFHMNYIYVHFIYTRAAISWSTSWIHPSWPRPWVRLSLLPTLFHIVSSVFVLAHLAACCLFQRLIISHVYPPLTTRRLNTPMQVNNMGMLHLMYTYLHHIIITIQLLLHTSSIFLGRPAGPDHSCRKQQWPRLYLA